jgi:hypothetical protein
MDEFDDTWSKVHRKAVEFHIASKNLEHCGHLLSNCRERCIDIGRHDLATNIEPLIEFGELYHLHFFLASLLTTAKVNVRAPKLLMA